MHIGSIPLSSGGRSFRQLSPTDVAQFIRLDQCERYLRLRLYQRNVDDGFMRDYGVVPQSIPPLLTQSGETFEQQVERAVADRFWKIHCVDDLAHGGRRDEDHERILRVIGQLARGETVVLLQPRLQVELEGWRIRGDIDILRMERDEAGELQVLIADIKSSSSAKVEHRLQVAFYHQMLQTLLTAEGVACAGIQMGILFRGPADGVTDADDQATVEQREQEYRACEAYFGSPVGLLEMVRDPESYLGAVQDLVTGQDSAAARVAEAPFDAVPFHLTYKCDGCMFNEFCMKWSAEHDDLSLLPHLTAEDKGALHRAGVTTTRRLAEMKQLGADGTVMAARGEEEVVRSLASTWPVGPRLDELVHRARRYRHWKGDGIETLPFIPGRGHGSLPYADASQNPNLVRVYIDAQHDYLQDRIYLLGALVVACEGGVEQPSRRRSIVHLAEGPPDTLERERLLFLRWTQDTLRAIVELAAPNNEGKPEAPVHLIFYNSFGQRLLLEGLQRHFTSITEATPLFDFVTQLAGFDSPLVTFLDGEIRQFKNYPMVCQSLQSVAAYLQFDWKQPEPFRDIFRTRMFDWWKKSDEAGEENGWYTGRARFTSQIPLEYAYAAWNELPHPAAGGQDDFATYRQATPGLLQGFQARRLEALEHITHTFTGNRLTSKTAFLLPDLAHFEGVAQTLAQAIDEFVTIERHVELAAWKSIRQAAPERRVLMGETLLVRYQEADQHPGVAEQNRENIDRYNRREQYVKVWRAEHPDARKTQLSKEQRTDSSWKQEGLRFRLRLECAGLDCALDEVLALTTLQEGTPLVIYERTTVDSRLPREEQVEFTPTPKQMLYGMRCSLVGVQVERDHRGRARTAWAEVEMREAHGKAPRGFAFGTIDERPLRAGGVYTLDPDPNNWYGSWYSKVTEELAMREPAHALYARLIGPDRVRATWPPKAAAGQELFLSGLSALRDVGAMEEFEPSKQEYIGKHGDTPILLVQGPPGTGKSYSTAFAVLARLQGAMAAGRDCRVFLTCKTHAATDVLLKNVVQVLDRLRALAVSHPDIFTAYFDARLLDLPFFRMLPRGEVPAGVTPLRKKEEADEEQPTHVETITAQRWCVVAAVPGGIYKLLSDRWPKNLFGHELCHCLVLDEASQMNLPEAVMAALPLAMDGQLVVVGDHRQMPPIVKHDWRNEPRRTFDAFRSYDSLFLTLRALQPPMIKFAESFRLHADIAEFLRQEIYRQDGIQYFSRRYDLLPPGDHRDPFVAAVLRPEQTIVVVVHDEGGSLMRNPVEEALITPVLEALSTTPYNFDARHGLGVVVPHRAQRAALQEAVPCLNVLDPETGAVTLSAVNTVERFQGDERLAVLVGATESDRAYLLLSGEFLLDPRRLTVALSRAKRKIVLVASRSVFSLFSADEETFGNAQLWKNLLRNTCTRQLWEGERAGHRVEVWGNH